MILADRYRSETATWSSGLDPTSAITSIIQQFSNWRWWWQNRGTSARIVPRTRGVPVYVFEISATPVPGGSEITTSVIPSTRAVARYFIVFAAICIVGLLLTLLKAALQVFSFAPGLLLIGGLGTLVFGVQFLGMGVARRGGSSRLASAMAAAGAVPTAPQSPPLDAPPEPPVTAP